VLPLSGWFSSIFGRKRFFMVCVGLFTVRSLLCGFAPNLGWLVFFRVLQGVGGGSMQPLSQAILVESFPKSRRGMAMAIYAMGVVVAPIVGPTVGGWITDNYTWRWIFFINIPIGVLSLMLTGATIEDPPYMHRRKLRELRIDYVGLGLLGIGLAALQIMLDKGEREDWFSSNFIVALLLITGSSLLVLVIWEWWQHDPVLELHLLKDRNFAGATATMFLLGFVLYGSLMLLPLLMQTLLGYTAQLSGMVLSPGGIVTLISLPLVGRLLAHFEARWLVVIGVVVTAFSLLLMSQFNLTVDFWTPTWARMIQGVGLAFLFVPVNSMAFYFIPRHKTNYAAGLINLARNVGGSCGIAFAATMLSRWSQAHQNYLVANLSPLNPQFQAATQAATSVLVQHGQTVTVAQDQARQLIYSSTVQQATMMSFNDVFFLMAATFLILIPVLFAMKKAPPHREGDLPAAH
jgi:DHA2 family multidrug resistance protein